MSEFTSGKAIPVRVALRARPLLSHELNGGAKECLTFIQDAQQVVVNGNKAFTFDYVFDAKTSQSSVYTTSVQPLIAGIFKGFNGTVLAYGQTGSGKTYSMGSAHCVSQASDSESSTGVIPRVINDLFDGIAKRDKFEFLVNVSYVEIYKEELKDLLAPGDNKHSNLAIRENPDGSIRIAGLTEVVVSSPSETMDFMERGNCARSTGSTAMNATSSRSHAIFTVILQSRSLEDADEYICSKFHLVDLAGSERAKRTKAQGERLQEGIKINAGLLALGNVISALGDRRHGDHHIPYRVSKLTRILQDSLGGNSLTVMIACVSPADCNAEESLNTLRYADRARKIKNKPMVNRDPQTAELVSLRKEVQQLRLKLLQTTGSTSTEVTTTRASPANQERIDALEEEKRQLVAEMQKLVDSNTDMCEKAITTDLMCERLQTKLAELRSEAEKVAEDPHDLSLAEQAIDEEQQRECIQNLRALHKRLLTANEGVECSPEDVISNLTTALLDKCPNGNVTDATSANSSMADESAMDTSLKADHILRTAKLSNQLQELTKALAMKEELAKRMCSGGENMGMLRSQYEEKLTKLDKQINDLQKEKDALANALEAAVKSNENRSISEQRRRRLLELENQIKDLKNEKREKEKVTKLKAQSDQKITKLNGEIQSIKSSRVKLMRQIKEENQKFIVMKKEKEREVKQLKEKDRKRQYEIVKLERDFLKQKNVLRRKTEEAAASNKRLKDALNKQKTAAHKRQQSQSKTLDSANTKMRAWLEEDIEIAVRAKEAKKHLEVLEEDLKVLQTELDSMETESPSKRRRTFVKSEADNMQRRRQQLEDEVELKVVQVKELKMKLQDAKHARTGQQTRWIQITSIAEARAIMKHLFGLTVASRLAEEEVIDEKRRFSEEANQVRIRCNELECQMEEFERDREQNITALETTHHEQMLLLTSQLNQSSSNRTVVPATQREADLQTQIKIQANVIEEMRKQQEILSRIKSVGDEEEKQTFFQPLDVTFKKPSKPKTKLAKPEIQYMTTDDSDNGDSEESDDDKISDYESESESEYEPTPRPKRTMKRSGLVKCSCAKTQCATRICTCRRAGASCSDSCGCDHETCKNTSDSGKIDITTSSGDGEKSMEIEENMNAPYYARQTGLFDSAENSPAVSPSKVLGGKGSKYKPVYFDSPLREANSTGGDSHDDDDVKPKRKVPSELKKQKKRRLLEPSDSLL